MSWEGPKGVEGPPGLTTEVYALQLLTEVLEKGWKQENPLIDTSWAVPIELYWKIDRLMEIIKKQEGQ